ncbi:MAG: alpha/beta hydrolase family protein, partial [Saprospiraceae bacterium]|nr:alpha/beta hydrolase family protein [Saprospiraceae bacterium]
VPHVLDLADRHDMIIVCPDGGTVSWYFDSPGDPASRYETHFTAELVPAVDHSYRTLPSPAGRAITGLSMGGHGALFLAIRHPDIWGAAGSMSGGLDIRPFHPYWNLDRHLGPIAQFPERWDAHTVINLLPQLKGRNTALMIDCGYGDFFFEVNLAAHQVLKEMAFPHTFVQRPGGHDWAYWSNAIKYQVLFFAEYFEGAKTRH